MFEGKKIAAFIPAAGLGTRLKPLTDKRPKALVQFMGKSMLESVLQKISNQGITRFFVNIHHFPDLMKIELERLRLEFDIVISDETEELLDTGGGLKKVLSLAHSEFDTLLVHNVDVYAQIDYQAFINSYLENCSALTLAVSSRETSRKLLFKNGLLRGWKNFKTDQVLGDYSDDDESYKAFSGIQLVNTNAMLPFLPKERRFPLIPWYISLIDKLEIAGWEHSSDSWFDLGTVDRIKSAELFVRNKKENE
jgi:NDP-sugar pyrophosphorylase family protein